MRCAIIGIDLGKNSCSLIVGATGGMGSATLDLTCAMGLWTLATTRVAAKADSLRERGGGRQGTAPALTRRAGIVFHCQD